MLERFQSGNPEHEAKVLLELAKFDVQEARYPAAIEKLRRAILLDEAESDPVRLTLGQVFEISHDTSAAVDEYRKVLASIPDDYELWAHIAELEAARGDEGAARAEFLRLKEKRRRRRGRRRLARGRRRERSGFPHGRAVSEGQLRP